MESAAINYDFLNFSKEKSIIKMLAPGEQILLSSPISKFNRKNKREERNFMVTNEAVFNLSKTSLKRKIPIHLIAAITVSEMGQEFVIHVPEEYDYRYASVDKRDQIVESLTKAYCNYTGKQLTFFFKDDVLLAAYATTKDDKKKGKNLMPTEGALKMNEELLKKYLSGELQKRDADAQNTRTLYPAQSTEKITIQDFNLLKVVGRGAFGKEDIIEKDQIEHTKTERVILEHCNHPFLVNLVYAFTTQDKIFFVTKFMKGGELFEHLRQAKRFPEKRAKFYAAEIALALGHLHLQNIIYRDLKPENILMDEEGHISLTDFGMAKILPKGEVAMSFCGTPEYLAPEIISGVGHSASADWWALGIFTFEMMFALPPFYNQNNQEAMFKAIRQSEIKFPNHTQVTEEAKDFILAITNKDPAKRLGSDKGVEDLKKHPWFADIDWEKLAKKEVVPPFKPAIEEGEWERNFDEEFTKEDPINSYAPTNAELVKEYEDEFKGFSYAEKPMEEH